MTEQYPFMLFYLLSICTRVLAYLAEEVISFRLTRSGRNTPSRSSMKGASIFAQALILLFPMLHAWELGWGSMPLYGLWLMQCYLMATYKPIILSENGLVRYNRPVILYYLFAFEGLIFTTIWFGFR